MKIKFYNLNKCFILKLILKINNSNKETKMLNIYFLNIVGCFMFS